LSYPHSIQSPQWHCLITKKGIIGHWPVITIEQNAGLPVRAQTLQTLKQVPSRRQGDIPLHYLMYWRGFQSFDLLEATGPNRRARRNAARSSVSGKSLGGRGKFPASLAVQPPDVISSIKPNSYGVSLHTRYKGVVGWRWQTLTNRLSKIGNRQAILIHQPPVSSIWTLSSDQLVYFLMCLNLRTGLDCSPAMLDWFRLSCDVRYLS